MQSKCAYVLIGLLMCSVMIPSVQATEGRDAPQCLSVSESTLSSQVLVVNDACMRFDLGTLQPGDVFEFSITVIDDSLDVLVFDESGLQPYLLGQSYRSTYQQVPSTEFANGEYEFHWKVPASINAKSWTVIIDNLAHDGDQGEGDQGGVDGRISMSVTQLIDTPWTPHHDLVGIIPDGYLTLLEGTSLQLEEGTTIAVTAWSLEGLADVYLQTESMNANYLSGQSNVALTGASLLAVDGTSSFSWVVPSALANQPLKLVVDNTDDPDGQGDGSTTVRITIRVQLVPVIQAQFVAENTTVPMNTLVGFDAASTPNNLGQISQYTWDFDSTVDGNNDGDFINDVDAIGLNSEAQWTSPGERNVTLTVLGQNSFDRQQQTITVDDINNPVPRITGTTASSSSATPVSGGWRIAYANTLVLTCNSSSDDDSISACSWSLDGAPYNQQTTVSFNWSTIGEHVVGLTVFDQSGNSASTQVDVRVVDGSIPMIDDDNFNPQKSLEEGQSYTYSINANDVYDSASNLRYHWDINPSKDTDQNGNPTDDPDYIGSNVDLLFDTAGTKTVVVTVFDASNNTDTRTFTIVVEESVESSTNFGLVAVVLFIFVVTLSISFIGYRRWQSSIAVGLLTGRGLSEPEAKAHMGMVRQSQKLPLFAKAIQLAGLDVGEVVTRDQQEQARKEAELQSIYGSGEVEEIPQAQFAPKREISQASSQAAAEAAALFFDDAPPAPAVETIAQDPDDALLQELGSMNENPPMAPQSGGIQLPENMAPPAEIPEPAPEIVEEEAPSNLLKGSCNSCSLKFQVPMPAGVNEAIVVCPSCSEEQLFQR
ncbi:MAG: hypothetical protein HOJ55_02325 [Euryarchaeota archaeon]|jgi:hypothetical protein|nr:hypothetical protein [Euryarchaeota archaeon]MBT5592665.1 hypothetical protein [Euryarchaeota archaeon]